MVPRLFPFQLARKLKDNPSVVPPVLACAALAMAASGALLHATVEPAQDQRPTFRAGVGRVAIRAVVRNRQGKPITDLTVGDFQLLDSGRPRPILDFRSDPSPVRLALLADFSGSMDVAEKKTMAMEAIWHLLNWLTAGKDEVSLYAFDRQIRELQAPTPAPGQVLEQLATMKPFGETSLFDAIAETGKLVANAGEGRRAVVALTDGADNASRLTPAEVSTLASAIDVPVYIVLVTSPLDRAGRTTLHAEQTQALVEGPIGNLARWTGGDSFVASSPSQASAAARQIVTELRHQYLIAFEPDPRPGWHPIELRTARDHAVVRTRSGYVVHGQPSLIP
jgi:Ca-activated chloride channel family protein